MEITLFHFFHGLDDSVNGFVDEVFREEAEGDEKDGHGEEREDDEPLPETGEPLNGPFPRYLNIKNTPYGMVFSVALLTGRFVVDGDHHRIEGFTLTQMRKDPRLGLGRETVEVFRIYFLADFRRKGRTDDDPVRPEYPDVLNIPRYKRFEEFLKFTAPPFKHDRDEAVPDDFRYENNPLAVIIRDLLLLHFNRLPGKNPHDDEQDQGGTDDVLSSERQRKQNVLLHLPVTVESRKEEIDPKIGKDNRDKAEHRDHRYLVSLPPAHKPCVEVEGVEKPGNERPCLFRVPAPVN